LIIVGAAVAAVLIAVLPLLGLAIFFRGEILDWLRPGDLAAGTRLVYRISPPESGTMLPSQQEMRKIVFKRIDPYGSRGYVVRFTQSDQLEVLVPAREGTAEIERVKRLLRAVGLLEFRIVADRIKDRDKANFDRLVKLKQEGKPPDDPRFRWYPYKEGWKLYASPRGNALEAWNSVYVVDPQMRTVEILVNVADGQDVSGRDISKAYASMSEGQPIVSFQMRPQAAQRFAKLTSLEMRDRQMAIILDGVIQSAPLLGATLTTAGVIQGYKSKRELEEVVSILNSGELGVRLGPPIREERFGSQAGGEDAERATRLAVEVHAVATEIAEDVIREHLRKAGAPGGDESVHRYIPAEDRQYLGKIRILLDVNPPATAGEIQNRIHSLIRRDYPELTETVCRVEGKTRAEVPGHFKLFEIWIRESFDARHADIPNPKFWTDLVEEAVRSGATVP